MLIITSNQVKTLYIFYLNEYLYVFIKMIIFVDKAITLPLM